MSIAAPVRTAAAGLRWPAVKLAPHPHQGAGREQQTAGAVQKRDLRRMPNGDPPPATLWGSETGA